MKFQRTSQKRLHCLSESNPTFHVFFLSVNFQGPIMSNFRPTFYIFKYIKTQSKALNEQKNLELNQSACHAVSELPTYYQLLVNKEISCCFLGSDQKDDALIKQSYVSMGSNAIMQ